MDIFLKASAGIIVATILSLMLSKGTKEFALFITLAACCIVFAAVLGYIKPILDFLDKLTLIGGISNETMKILFKAVGISLLADFTTSICADSGNAAMGKMLQILASVIILWLSIPLFNSLIDLVSTLIEKT